MEKEITLLEALTGVNFVINFLDGTKVSVSNKPGEIIKPDMLMTVEDKGLPFHKNPYKFGNLFILFSVKFPKSLADEQIDLVGKVLKNQKKQEDENMDISETVNLISFSDDQRNTHAQGGTKAYGSDGEEEEDPRMGGGQRVQCAQQ